MPGDAFGPSGAGHVRMCYATAYEQLEEAIARIGRFVDAGAAGLSDPSRPGAARRGAREVCTPRSSHCVAATGRILHATPVACERTWCNGSTIGAPGVAQVQPDDHPMHPDRPRRRLTRPA